MIDIEKFWATEGRREIGFLGIGPDGRESALALRVWENGFWSLYWENYGRYWCDGPPETLDWAFGVLVAARDRRRAGRVDAHAAA